MDFYTASHQALQEASSNLRLWRDWVQNPTDPRASEQIWREIRRGGMQVPEAMGKVVSAANLAKVAAAPALEELVRQARTQMPQMAAAFQRRSLEVRMVPLIGILARPVTDQESTRAAQQLEHLLGTLWVQSANAPDAVETFLDAFVAATEGLQHQYRPALMRELARIAMAAHLSAITAWISLALLNPEAEEGLRCTDGEMNDPWRFESDEPIGPGNEVEWLVYRSVERAREGEAENEAFDVEDRFDMTAPPPAEMIPFITLDQPSAYEIAAGNAQHYYDLDDEEAHEALGTQGFVSGEMQGIQEEMDANREAYDDLDMGDDEGPEVEARKSALDAAYAALATRAREALSQGARQEEIEEIMENPVGYFAQREITTLGELEALHVTIDYEGYFRRVYAENPDYFNEQVDTVDGEPLQLLHGMVAYGREEG